MKLNINVNPDYKALQFSFKNMSEVVRIPSVMYNVAAIKASSPSFLHFAIIIRKKVKIEYRVDASSKKKREKLNQLNDIAKLIVLFFIYQNSNYTTNYSY